MPKTLKSILLLLILIFSTSSVVLAAEEVSFKLKPTSLLLSISKEQESIQELKFTNDGDLPAEIEFTVEDLEDLPSELSMESWINIEPKSFTLKPSKFKFVTITVTVPKEAEIGLHHGRIVAQVLPIQSQEDERKVIQTGSNYVTKLSVRVPGTVNELATLKSFTYDRETNLFNILLRNEGNVYLQPTGIITIEDFVFQRKFELPIISEIIPSGQEKMIQVSWDTDPGWGYHEVFLDLSYGDFGKSLTARMSLRLIPLEAKVSVILFIAVVLIAYLVYKKHHHHIDKRVDPKAYKAKRDKKNKGDKSNWAKLARQKENVKKDK